MNLHIYTSNLQQHLNSHSVCVIVEIAEHILINLLDHNVELQTSLQYFSNFANKNKHCVNLNVVTIWKCKYASSHHNNLMINSLLILWSSDFIWFSKSYDQQFGGLKIKINALL